MAAAAATAAAAAVATTKVAHASASAAQFDTLLFQARFPGRRPSGIVLSLAPGTIVGAVHPYDTARSAPVLTWFLGTWRARVWVGMLSTRPAVAVAGQPWAAGQQHGQDAA